jgi:hypothetical protein
MTVPKSTRVTCYTYGAEAEKTSRAAPSSTPSAATATSTHTTGRKCRSIMLSFKEQLIEAVYALPVYTGHLVGAGRSGARRARMRPASATAAFASSSVPAVLR